MKIVAGIVILILGAGYWMYVESQKTRLRLARDQANKTMQDATRTMQERPDQSDRIVRALGVVNSALLSQDKDFFGTSDEGKISQNVEDATVGLQRAITEASRAPRAAAPASPSAPASPGCFDRYGPIPGCR